MVRGTLAPLRRPHQRPQPQAQQHKPGRGEMARHGEGHRRSRTAKASPLGDGPGRPRQREWRHPHAPQLRPQAVAQPRIAEQLEAVAGGRHQQRRAHRRQRRGAGPQPKSTGRDRHRDRPRGPERPVGPHKRRLRADRPAEQPGHRMGQALIVMKLGEARAETVEPTVEGQVAGADAARRPIDHRLVKARVVGVAHPLQQRPSGPAVGRDRGGDQQQVAPAPAVYPGADGVADVHPSVASASSRCSERRHTLDPGANARPARSAVKGSPVISTSPSGQRSITSSAM